MPKVRRMRMQDKAEDCICVNGADRPENEIRFVIDSPFAKA